MTQYASKHPQSFGHVNRVREGVVPAFCACGRVCVSMAGHWAEVTANDPSVILPMVRESLTNWDESEDGDGPWEYRFHRWIQYCENGDVEPDERYPFEDEFEHAILVLRRLDRLARS